MHLVVDGYAEEIDKLTDENLLFTFLDEYPKAINMTKMIVPQVYTYHGKTREDWGLSGFVLIAESHISVHTFPERLYINIDIFSCKEFDSESSIDDVKTFFGLREVRISVMDRGVDYSNPRSAFNGMVGERVEIINTRSVTDGQ